MCVKGCSIGIQMQREVHLFQRYFSVGPIFKN